MPDPTLNYQVYWTATEMQSQRELQRRVFLTGTFDVKNFGDLLYPLIARERLSRIGVDVVAVSPTGAEAGLADAMPSIGLQEMFAGEIEVNGIVVGGGYVIHTHNMRFLDEYRSCGDFAVPGLWLGAALAASVRDVPLVWNAPGVPHPFAASQRVLVDAAVRAADYLAVRDRESLTLLGADTDLYAGVVPDSVAAIAELWSPAALEPAFKRLIQRKLADPAARHFVLHVRKASLGGMSPADAAALVDDFTRAHHLCPVLVAIGQSLDDDSLARTIARHLRTKHVVLDDPVSLTEIAAAIAHSCLYVGASLHGYVAAAAYGIPAVAVALPFPRKFKGFVDHTGRQKDLAQNWREAFATAAIRMAEQDKPRIPASVFAALDGHWSRIGEALADSGRNRPNRQAFLRTWFKAGVRANGPAWAHLPYTRRSGAEELSPPNDKLSGPATATIS
jgi:polysaccharide pyruvyl transferase WcaK-like protein